MDSKLEPIVIAIAFLAGLWLIFKLIEPFFDHLDRRQTAKALQACGGVAAVLGQRPKAVAAFKRLNEEAAAVLKELGEKEVTFTFHA